MKKLVSLLLLVCITLAAPLALAADDPFKPGVDYSQRYEDSGAMPSMLNFGYANLGPGESFYNAKTTTVTKASASSTEKSLSKVDYYIYAKWQYAFAFDYSYIEAMLVMTDPTGNYYADTYEMELTDSQRNSIWRTFFDVNNLLEECAEDHGSLPRGQYTFSLFFNDQVFRVNKVQLT